MKLRETPLIMGRMPRPLDHSANTNPARASNAGAASMLRQKSKTFRVKKSSV